jgi:hypothetical protein
MSDTVPSRKITISSAILSAALLQASSALPATIPSLHGTTFTGESVDLPAALHGKAGILVVGFSQASRNATTAWGKHLAADFYDSSSVTYYEMPVLAAVPRLMRGFVEGRIKADVSDRGKPHFLPITSDESAWRTIVHYSDPDAPYILLIDEHGSVHWQAQGPPTAATYAILKQQLKTILPR